MTSESTGYRFLDSQDEVVDEIHRNTSIDVEFNPSIEDYVYLASNRNASRRSITPWTKFILQTFYVINAIGLPATLFLFGRPILAIIFFALNLFLAGFLLSATVRFDYRRYFRSLYGDEFETEVVRVELTRDGVHMTHDCNSSFHRWRSILSIEETTESIYLHLRAGAITIRKSGFAFEEEKKRFLIFASERLRDVRAQQLTP
jgi:hypothetical protein